MRFLKTSLVLAVLLIGVGIVPEAKPQAKSASAELCPDEKTYTGKYRNWLYGFSMAIPAGLKARWNSARCAKDAEGCVCMSDHGRYIPLSEDAGIEIYAGYDVLEQSRDEDEQFEIEFLSKENGVERVERVSSGENQLGKLRAHTLLLKFVKEGKIGFKEEITAKHKGVEYTLTLRTWEDRHQQDRRKFKQVIASWKLTRRSA